MTDNYNPALHKGALPVRVLQGEMLGWFESIDPSLRMDMIDEIERKGLQPGITYVIADHVVMKKALIHPVLDSAGKVRGHRIEVHEPYLQILWCTSYALTVLYEEGYLKPGAIGRYDGRFDFSQHYVSKAIDVFNLGQGLKKQFKPHPFFLLPNPKETQEEDYGHVKEVGYVFCAAVAFVLTHELGHKKIGHVYEAVPDDIAREKEHEADQYAAAWMKKAIGTEREKSTIFGVIAALTVRLLFDSDHTGSSRHPPAYERMSRVLQTMDSEEPNEQLWAAACFGLLFWTIAFPGVKFKPETAHESYKPIFEEGLAAILKQAKENNA